MVEPIHILVIDTDEARARALVEMLHALGYNAASLTAALEHAGEIVGCAEVTLVELTENISYDPIALAHELVDEHDASVVFAVSHASDDLLKRARNCGPQGYLFRPFSPETLHAVIELARPLEDGASDDARPSHVGPARGASRPLTVREQEIFEALARGARPPEIARSLFISVHTVRRHAQAVFRKLDVHSQIELIHRYGAPNGKRKAH